MARDLSPAGVSCLVIAGLFFLCPLVTRAQDEEAGGADSEELEEEFELLQDSTIVLAPAKHRQEIESSPSAVIVITRRDIEEAGATSLMQLLRRYPAVHVYEFDPLYPTAMVRATIRVLIRIDGREANTEFYPSPFYEMLPVALEDIERIEIVLGPNSALYGANAVSAVIDITTRRPGKKLSAEAALAGGEHGQLRAGLRLEGNLGSVSAQGAVHLDQASSWMEPGPLIKDLLRASAFASTQIGELVLQCNAGMVSGSGNIYGVLGNMDFDSFLFPSAGIFFRLSDVKGRLWWSALRADFALDLDLVYPGVGELARLPKFHLAGDTVHGEVQYDLSLWDERFLIIAGADARGTWYRSEQLVREEITEWRSGFFLHLELQPLDWLRLTAGGRLDYNSRTPLAFSPRGAAVFVLGEGHSLRVSAGTAFRKPTLIETSANFRVEPNPAFADEMRYLFEEKGISNPDLDNEILTGFEMGYRGEIWERRLRFSVDIYFNLNRKWVNFITDIRFRPPPFQMQIDLDNSFLGYRNSGADFNLLGVSVSAQLHAADYLDLFTRAEWRREWDVSGSDSFTQTAPWQMAAGATIRFPFAVTADMAWLYTSARDDYVRNPQSSLLPNSWLELPAVSWLTFSAKKTFELPGGGLEVGFSFFNPFRRMAREKAGIIDQQGQNYGGELIGRLVMFTARLRI